MPDLQNHRVIVRADQRPAVAIPRVHIEATVEKDDGTTIDLTGANAIEFYVRVQGLDRQGHMDLIEKIESWIINRRAGIE